ncbi:hypothetical protein [Nonomuraea sp. GTA35]|uniref:hypothetical protein n=1 Tax=Nonomuraea sp. GTA35 TaxID=1676746 RepID=UPI0035C26768
MRLEKGGIVKIEKTAERRPRTVVSLTGPGRTTVAEHWDRLIRLHEVARNRIPSEP